MKKVKILMTDLFVSTAGFLIISSLVEVILPGFVTSVFDLRLFLALFVCVAAYCASQRADEGSDNKLQRRFAVSWFVAGFLLLVGIIALQQSSLLIRLSLIVAVLISCSLLLFFGINDSRRRHKTTGGS